MTMLRPRATLSDSRPAAFADLDAIAKLVEGR